MLAAAVFWVFVTATGGDAGSNAVLVVAMFLFLLVFGWLFDRWFYRWRLRRWQRKQAGTA